MKVRSSGVLLHVTSLPGEFGIGDLGPAARWFADILAENGQSVWQVLPLNPTDTAHGNSPYHSSSAFAGNPLTISPELLAKEGWASDEEIADGRDASGGHVNFETVTKYKERLFDIAYERFERGGKKFFEFDRFCDENSDWLDDCALFTVLRGQYPERSWKDWPIPLRDREPAALSEANELFHDRIKKEKFLQFLFYSQWRDLKAYCNRRGVRIFGDIPIYMPYESVDVWINPRGYKLDDHFNPQGVSGVPPDYFSSTGQLWGHPVYDWNERRQKRYPWWTRRIDHNLELFDIVRIDHFRGLVGYWEVPPDHKTAAGGRWIEAPAEDLLSHLHKRRGCLPIVAEDLGIITSDVKEIIRRFDLPGMRVLQFGFGGDFPGSNHLPHLHEKNCFVYTGSHDNNTTAGWYANEIGEDARKNIHQYIGRTVDQDEIHREMIRLAMMSVADTAIVPVQDIVGLGSEARMNTPGIGAGNWAWRLRRDELTPVIMDKFRSMTRTYGR